jgi:hypothetical protein
MVSPHQLFTAHATESALLFDEAGILRGKEAWWRPPTSTESVTLLLFSYLGVA